MTFRSIYYILDDDGTPVMVEDALEWGRWFEANHDRRIVARDRDEGGGTTVYITTVFLGLDHQYGDGPPLIYETMIFEGPLAGETGRYTTREQALAGHQATCLRVRAALHPPD